MGTDARDPRNFFSRHHAAYVRSPRHARGEDLFRLIGGLRLAAGEAALDVAVGGGHTAVQLARHGLSVTVVDVTPAMLAAAVEFGRQQGVSLTAVEAPAEALPFADASFHVVTCRRAAHHFTDLGAFLAEAARILVPGGQLGISDMTASPASIAWLNALERLRDPSHRAARPVEAWHEAVATAGFTAIRTEVWSEAMTPQEWCYPVDPESSEGRRALARIASLDAPPECVADGRFVKQRLLLWAETPAGREGGGIESCGWS